jgi:site-specific DNA recombinase
MSNVAIYVRVSTEEQARGENNSLDNQIYRCERYLSSNYDDPEAMRQPKIYREEGYSGKNTNRPAYQKMMRDIRNGSVETVVFTELSRISRSVTDFLELVEEFETLGVEFVSLREKFDTTSPHGKLIMTILMALNQFEREQTSLRTRLNMRARSEQGLWSGGHVPLGYKLGPSKSGLLEVDEKAATIVRALFETYTELGSIAQTLEAVKERGIKRPAYQNKAGELRASRDFSDGSIRNTLQNPTYLGLKEVNRKNRRLAQEKLEKVPEEEQYHTVKATWPAIVSDALFARATQIMARNRTTKHSCLAKKRHDYILSGLVYCETCEALLEGESSKSNTIYYYRHPVGTGSSHCKRKRWRAEILEEAVIKHLGKLAKDDKLFERVLKRAKKIIKAEQPVLRNDLKETKRRLIEVDSDRATLLKLATRNGNDVPPSLFSDIRGKDAEAQHLRAEMERLKDELGTWERQAVDADRFRQELQKLAANFKKIPSDQQYKLLRSVIDSLHVDQDGDAWIFLLEKAEAWDMAMREGAKRKRAHGKVRGPFDWLRRRGSNSRQGG